MASPAAMQRKLHLQQEGPARLVSVWRESCGTGGKSDTVPCTGTG